MNSLSEAIADAKAGRTSTICCPAHEDRNPSLSVRPPGPSGWIGIKCFAGCDRNDVLAAGGVALYELGPERTFRTLTFVSQSGRSLTYTPGSFSARPSPRTELEPWKEMERLERKKRWPAFEAPREGELATIAQLRGIPIEALQIAVQRGILRVIVEGGDKAVHWVVTDTQQHVAQKRSFDGSLLPKGSGPVKALTLPGSVTCWPVGLAALRPEHRSVLLVEGGPDLLAAFEFIRREEREADTHAIAMLGAKARIHPSLHHHFAGKTVRIIQHSDEAGEEAGREWGNQLLKFAEHVEVLDFGHLQKRDGSKVKDLNDALLVDQATYNQEPHLRRLVP
jgi:hypothetical protein